MKGGWSCISADNDVFVMECSNCGGRTTIPAVTTDAESLWKELEFCPFCNADMRSEEAIAEADRMKQKEDDLIERIADRVVEKMNKPKQGDWIPCSERLPEANEVVLVCYKTTDTIHLCKYLGDGSENPWWSYIDDCCAWNNTVLAWMPLPKPWEGADDED